MGGNLFVEGGNNEGERTSTYNNYFRNYLRKHGISNINSTSPIVRNLILQAQKEFISKYGQLNVPSVGVIDKNKVSNRMPAIASEYSDNNFNKTIILKNAVIKYFNGDDNTVKNKLYKAKINNSKLDNEYLDLEDAKNLYLDLPQRNNRLQPAKYKPTVNNNTHDRYFEYKSYEPNGIFAEDLINAGDRLRLGDFKVIKNNGLLNYNPNKTFQERMLINGNMLTFLPSVGQTTVGYGVDNKGQYYSLFDDWDLNFSTNGGGSKIINKILGGKKVNTYNRLYIDDYYKNKYDIKSSHNSWWLPEITIKG